MFDKKKVKKALRDFWYGKPHGERRLNTENGVVSKTQVTISGTSGATTISRW